MSKAFEADLRAAVYCGLDDMAHCCQVGELGGFEVNHVPKGGIVYDADISRCIQAQDAERLATIATTIQFQRGVITKTLKDYNFRPLFKWKSPNTRNTITLWLRPVGGKW